MSCPSQVFALSERPLLKILPKLEVFTKAPARVYPTSSGVSSKKVSEQSNTLRIIKCNNVLDNNDQTVQLLL